MEAWAKEIILRNMNKLVKVTICNIYLLTKLLESEMLSEEDVEELIVLKREPSTQAYQFYNIMLKRKNGYEKLLQALQDTKQSGALGILEKEAIAKGRMDDTISITYDEKAVLGRGSYGTIVYKGTLGDKEIAVKKLQPDVIDVSVASHEIDILKACDAHENIVRYFGSKIGAGFILILLELCEINLREWVANKAVDILPMEILRQATVGLEWLHSASIVHRDLKPENILLVRKLARVKISDFGLSRRIVDGRSCVSTSVLGGTQGWVAPEILAQVIKGDPRQCKFTFASDIFALGCVYYYVMTDGKHAFGDSVRVQVNILDGKSLINITEVLHCCVQNVLFVRLMISSNPKSRPSCSTLLATPMFWTDNRRTQFLEHLFKGHDASVQTFLQSKWKESCVTDHRAELGKLRSFGIEQKETLGCVITVAYLQCQGIAGNVEQYFYSGEEFDRTEVGKLMDNAGGPLFDIKIRSEEKPSVTREKNKSISPSNFEEAKEIKPAVVQLPPLTPEFKFVPKPLNQNTTTLTKNPPIKFATSKSSTNQNIDTSSRPKTNPLPISSTSSSLLDYDKNQLEKLNSGKQTSELRHAQLQQETNEIAAPLVVPDLKVVTLKRFFENSKMEAAASNTVLQQNERELMNPKDVHFKSSNLDTETREYDKLASESNPEIVRKYESITKRFQVATLFEVVQTKELPTIIQMFDNVAQKEFKIIDVWDPNLKSILHVAATTREYAVVEYLVTKHGFLNVLSEERFRKHSLVHDCIRNIHTIGPHEFEEKCRILQLFFDMKSELVDSWDTDYYKSTPLHIAMMRDFKNSKQLEFIQFLIQNKADVNATDDRERSPLHCIIETNPTSPKLLDIFKLLIENGVDSDLPSRHLYNRTPLHLAAQTLSPTEFHRIVQYLETIDRTKSFTAVDEFGNTVLHNAVINREPLQETLAILKSHGADFNAVNTNQNTILANAIKGGRSASFLNILLAFGADWRKLGRNEQSVLHNSAYYGNLPALKLFISMGADINARSKFGHTPLFEVIYRRAHVPNQTKHQIIEELLKCGAYVNIPDNKNNLPLAFAKQRAKTGDLLQCTVDLLEQSSRKYSFY
ncbi:Serine/threonine-protein kinase/endoribonuclease IRE2 [Orchesella cincta]|uniref:non-specific serine/threonine protein kinase n=1 Tax=Orchesella cincta TaxID=48709 RepID=A0A1D2M7E9_ORCCI|nr:Serine/threonine-protein kinase/endoribonuclease IRE2 [Orchesella cincta]